MQASRCRRPGNGIVEVRQRGGQREARKDSRPNRLVNWVSIARAAGNSSDRRQQ